MKLVTADQMRRLEQACIPLGVSLDDLMERAGLEVARCARSLLGGAAGRRIVVLVGPGNNGADGFVAARHLQRWGAEVTAHVLGRRLQSDPKRELALHEGIFLHDITDEAYLPATTTRSCRLRLGDRRCAGNGTGASHGGAVARGDGSLAGCARLSELPYKCLHWTCRQGLDSLTRAKWTLTVPKRT